MADRTEDRPTSAVLDEPYDAPHHGRAEDVWDALARGLLILVTIVFLAAVTWWAVVLFMSATS
jgi:hypothetical protein